MSGGRAEFEILALRDERWVLEETRETESAARQVAKGVLNKPRVGGVKVVKSWHRADGQTTETVVLEETRAVADPPVTIVPIDEAPQCSQLSDFYKLDSRLTMGRLLRKYVEQVFLTPTELMHNYKALKKLQEADTLYPSAVDRVASVQAKAAGTDAKVRRDELHKFAAQASQRVRKVEESGSLPDIKGTDFKASYERVKRMAPPDEAAYMGLVVLCRDLVQHRDWLAKLARIAELIQPDGEEEILTLFDRVMADLVATPAALQDILGAHRNLGAALSAIIDLHDNGTPAEKSDARDEIAKIGPLIASGRMRETRISLIERLCRQLGSSQPLSRNDPDKERDTIKEVIGKLFRANGILGGPDAAAAMTRRYVYLQEGGGLTALKNSVGGVCGSMKDLLDRVIYLLELAKSELGKDLRETISSQLSLLIEVNDLSSLAPEAKDVTEKLFAVKRIFEALKGDGAKGLPDEERARLVERLDTLLAEFIKREGIIEKLDNPQAPLRDRAMRLVEFCGSGILPDGRALRAARERVVTHLRQPNFDRALIEGMTDPAKCAELLRDFHGRLVRAGFR
ncbi:MAG TPA: hypothetical protein VGG27_09595 [Magnetospirillaceae bacterium]